MARDGALLSGCVLLLCLACLHRRRCGGGGSWHRGVWEQPDPGQEVLTMMLFLLFALMLLLMLLGMHIGLALAASSLLYLLFHLSGSLALPLGVIPQKMVYGVDSFPLLAVPLFMLAGELMSAGGITARIVRFATSLVGWITGGLAHVVIVVNMIMAGMSGSAVADAAATGSVLIPAMIKARFPPSVRCRSDRGSVHHRSDDPRRQHPLRPDRHYCPGFDWQAIPGRGGPGGHHGPLPDGRGPTGWPSGTDTPWKTRDRTRNWTSFWPAIPALLMPLIIMGGILSGIATPTEAAVLWAWCMPCFSPSVSTGNCPSATSTGSAREWGVRRRPS